MNQISRSWFFSRVVLVVFIATLTAGLAAGCSDSEGTKDKTVVNGVVKEKVGCKLVPIYNAVVDVTSGGAVVSTVKTGSDGSYSVEVSPGAYTLYFKKTAAVSQLILSAETTEVRTRSVDTGAGVTQANVTFSNEAEAMRVISEPNDGQAPIVQLIQSASDSIMISIYQIVDESFQMDTDVLNALSTASANGVSVHFVFNDFNNTDWPKIGPQYLSYEESYANSNKMSYQLSSKSFTYTHNKYMIIDNYLAVIMTGNLDSGSFPPYGYTKNFYVVDTHASHVDYLADLFSYDVQNGENETGYTPSNAPDALLVNPNDGYSVSQLAHFIGNATESLDIYIMYFDSDCPQEIFDAINNGATDGVTTRIIASNIQETSVVTSFLANAVSSGNFQMIIQPSGTSTSSAPFIHTKTFITDQENVFLGSMNMSYTSLMENRELDLVTSDSGVASTIESEFNSDWNTFSVNKDCTFIPPLNN